MTLVELKAHTTARIAEIRADEALCARLYAIGICVGAFIHKTRNSTHRHPIFVSTQQACTFALGYDLAEKIVITPE
jgi:Fe2+ transport system protein FeoA